MKTTTKAGIVLTFCAVLLVHFFWKSAELQPNSAWVDAAELSEQAGMSGYSLYFQDNEYFLGLSYALALAFSVFALSRVKTGKTRGVIGMFSGVSLSAGLYAFGCFLVGCCGSPMAVVYAGLLGSSFLGFTKPFIFLITTLSVAFGYWMMTKRPKGECCSVSEMEAKSEITQTLRKKRVRT